MSDEQLADYQLHRDAFFGEVRPVFENTDDPYRLFEFFLYAHRSMPREGLLELFKDAPDVEALRGLGREDLLLECCERWVAGAVSSRTKP